MTPREVLMRLRAWWLGIVGVGLLIAYVAPQQVEVAIYKVALIVLSVPLAYAADRTLFRNAPKVDFAARDTVTAARLLTRALITTAVIIGLTLGI